MNKITTFVGLDVHKETISVAMAVGDGEPSSWKKIRNRPEEIAEMVKKMGTKDTIYTYEAGPTGYVLCRQLQELGARCLVAAPSKIEKAPGERVKTDRRDALKLVRLLRRGDLCEVWVLSPEQEAFRDLTRARTAAKRDQQRTRNRITKLLLRLGVKEPTGVKRWTIRYRQWLSELCLEQPWQQVVLAELRLTLEEATHRVERLLNHLKAACKTHPQADLIQALQTLRGVALITAATTVAELGDPARFPTARRLMGYVGYSVNEHSSGQRVHRGSITKTGNAHLRHPLGEAAWQQARPVKVGKVLQQRRRGQPPTVVAIAEKADKRLNARYWRLVHLGKLPQVAAVAVSRELTGFIWAIAVEVTRLSASASSESTAA